MDATTAVAPEPILDTRVRLSYEGPWGDSRVWYASPDADGGRAHEVTDSVRAFDAADGRRDVEFTLARLGYWTVVWLERRPTVEDLHRSHAPPWDANRDGVADEADVALLREWLRRDERADMLAPARCADRRPDRCSPPRRSLPTTFLDAPTRRAERS